MRALLPIPALAILTGLATGLGREAEDPVDFVTQVRPVLRERCVECHGPDRQKAGLRLDLRAAALAGSYGGEEQVILPGDGESSPLWRRVAGRVEGEDRMPPKGEPLSEAETRLLKRWIDEGASWPEEGGGEPTGPLVTHWAYLPPVRPELPAVRDEAWCRSPFDRFVLARLESEGLAPAPEAGRETLLRRVTLDLTGLPPSPEEIDAFGADEAPDAYERVVEALLASPAYAEHMTRMWLDLARYADTNGYEKDETRQAWRWRDWVLDAFVDDLPFDRFTIEQLAGDLLPGATVEQQVATGFHRNTMTNLEGGTDPEEFRTVAVIDRVNTTATVWLGTTLACAQCHNHKYDPFSQTEYFQLYAFFDSTGDSGNSLEPRLRVPTAEQRAELERLQAEVARLDAQLEQPWPDVGDEQAAWERRARALVQDPPTWRVARPLGASATSGATLDAREDGRVVVSGPEAGTDAYELELEAPAGAVTALRLEALALEDDPDGRPGPGRAAHGNFVLTGVELGPAGRAAGEALIGAWASHEQAGFPVRAAIDGNSRSGWAVSDGQRSLPATAVFTLAQPLQLAAPSRLRVALRFASPHGYHALGSFRLALSSSADVAPFEELTPAVRAALAVAPQEREESQRATLERHWRRRVSARGRPLQAQLEHARSAADAVEAAAPWALVLRELPAPRETRVFERGSFLSPGERVEPDVPSALSAWPEDAPRNRLGLARWLVDPANPLTARVTVNRFWQRLFGTGIVASDDDFGTRGDAPSHPALLDWLAIDFVEDGWSVKRLLRRLVTSATYRQSSRVTPELHERDPRNVLLARAPRLRLEAEVVRDCALAAAGLLERTVGGPSAFPPQPPGIWASTYSSEQWVTAPDATRWRRGLYTFLKRTSPYPSTMVFDGVSREVTCTRRSRTNTPLQALTLLNDLVYVEAAVGLARRVLREVGDFPVDLANHAFRLVHGRWPRASELEVLMELYEVELERFLADPDAALALTRMPVPPPQDQAARLAGHPPLADSRPEQLAALTVLASTLLNTDEFVTRD